MGTGLEPHEELALYEALGSLATTAPWENEFTDVLMMLTGTVMQETRHMGRHAAFNPDRLHDARKVALRWLVDTGRLPRP